MKLTTRWTVAESNLDESWAAGTGVTVASHVAKTVLVINLLGRPAGPKPGLRPLEGQRDIKS